MSIQQVLTILAILQEVLLYRLEMDDDYEDVATGPAINKSVFFEHLYSEHKGIELEIRTALINYRKPIGLFGKQGSGKTSILNKVLIDLNHYLDHTLISIRCKPNDAQWFQNIETLEEFLRSALHFTIAVGGDDVFGYLAELLRQDGSYLENVTDPATRNLYLELKKIYVDKNYGSKLSQSFIEWVVYALQFSRDEIGGHVRAFESSMRLSTLVELYSASKNARHCVIFCVDNIDSLLNYDAIRTAVSLMVRAQSSVGRKGRIIIGSRPKTFRHIYGRLMEQYPDAGHNFYERILVHKHLRAVVIPEDEVFSNVQDIVEQLSEGLTSPVPHSYWATLQKRLRYALQSCDGSNLAPTIEEILQEFHDLLQESPTSCDLVTGLSNHSIRTFLLTICNFFEYLVKTLNIGENIGEFNISLRGRLTSVSDGVHETSTSAAVYSQLCYYLGSCGAGIPGVEDNRLKPSVMLSQYKLCRQMNDEAWLPFLVLKAFDGCDLAGHFVPQGSMTRAAPNQRSAADLEAMFATFGYKDRQILDVCTWLTTTDDWQLACLEFSKSLDFSVAHVITPDAELQLEPRGWVLANELPFRLHYWLGDQASTDSGKVSSSFLSVSQLIDVLDLVVVFADLEMNFARLTKGFEGNPRRDYQRITHLAATWCFSKTVLQFDRYLRYFASRMKVSSAAGEVFQRQLDVLISRESGQRHILERLHSELVSLVDEGCNQDKAPSPIWTSLRLEFWRKAKAEIKGVC